MKHFDLSAISDNMRRATGDKKKQFSQKYLYYSEVWLYSVFPETEIRHWPKHLLFWKCDMSDTQLL